jgi:D-alanine-D-alanine ligase
VNADRTPHPPRSAGAWHAKRRVAVLYGGISAEREVSLSTGRQVIAALRDGGFDVTPIEVTDDIAAVVSALTPRPDAVFNALHGRFGEDGAIQGVLDWLGIPYTHSGVRASALAMDKVAAKALFVANGLPVARHVVVDRAELAAYDPLPVPYVIKPLNEGSSVGVEIIRNGDNRRSAIARAWRFGQTALVEEYVPGRELTVGVMGDRALAVTEILADAGAFYDYESKYCDGGSRHVIPAAVHPDTYHRALDVALAAHRALGCRGATRCDFRYDDTTGEPGRLVLLEINTQPGLTPTSLLPEQAAHHGMNFAQLCTWMVENAACRA